MPRPTRNRQPTGTKSEPVAQPRLPQDVATAAETRGLTPLAYMLRVLRDPKASKQRRDRMAVVAARYIHARPADSIGKKHLLAEAAREAGGDEWADDLDGDWRQ